MISVQPEESIRYLTRTIFFFLWSFVGLAQTPDVIRAEYMLMPRNDSDAELSRMKLLVNVPIKVRDSNNVILGAEYNRLAYNLERELPFSSAGLKQFHVLDFNMAYVWKFNPNWRFIGVVTPRLASTLTNPLENGDFSVNATVGFFKEKKNIDKPMILVLGVAYNSTVALRIPLPIFYYERRFSKSWSFVVGIPKTGMKFHLKERHQFQTEFIFDGYYVNLQNNIVLPNTVSASSVSSSAALVTVGYQFRLAANTFIYAYAGHTVFQDGVLRDADRNDIFTLNDNPSLYFRTGFRIGL
ncbi:DUF6268 family outer membrane beta-barrel protein [Zobellia galactanivorans]|uniref:DUF6268 family outer membrane beta-barrel protein n=1 Tax=Zobellia TaxID=112040 RepID=UPI0002FD5A43|nr:MULTISPECIES: DUF6268 family outer membrane beta-barrel protein [Zobellia]MBU3025435.1 hypothetical protein [Zobellia galactanivorans]MDO6810348.1 DUF6268 family outer membrane beta-barrel protein [Zobellia galactanivorans]OWW25173.1 hypothetical protein B4Q04_11585 [Zobellia sp. OII3]